METYYVQGVKPSWQTWNEKFAVEELDICWKLFYHFTKSWATSSGGSVEEMKLHNADMVHAYLNQVILFWRSL